MQAGWLGKHLSPLGFTRRVWLWGPAWSSAGPRLQLPVPLALACARGLGLAFLGAGKQQGLAIM